MEVEPGEELQVEFGTGAKIRGTDGTYRRTHAFQIADLWVSHKAGIREWSTR
jgi:hypothetical protein